MIAVWLMLYDCCKTNAAWLITFSFIKTIISLPTQNFHNVWCSLTTGGWHYLQKSVLAHNSWCVLDNKMIPKSGHAQSKGQSKTSYSTKLPSFSCATLARPLHCCLQLYLLLFFFLGFLWQPIEPIGQKCWNLAHWLSTVPSSSSPSFRLTAQTL